MGVAWTWAPQPGVAWKDEPPWGVQGDIELSQRPKALARQIWDQQGWPTTTPKP